MPATFTQQERRIAVQTPLGEDKLLLLRFTGSEGVSQLFRLKLDVASPEAAIKPSDIVGQPAAIVVKPTGDEPDRYIHGIVRHFSAGGKSVGGLRSYSAELVPRLWLLTRNAACRIFQDMSVVEIIEKILGERGVTDLKKQLNGNYPKLTYCVQYRETDFNFVSRLMEEWGIFYFHEHESSKHTLVLGDHAGAYADCGQNEAEFRSGTTFDNVIYDWEHNYEFRTGVWTYRDYNFEEPATDLTVSENSVVELPGMPDFEIYDYPGSYAVKGDGQDLIKLRAEADEAQHDIVAAGGNCATFTPGHKFTLKEHDCDEENGEYVITTITHSASAGSYFGDNGSPSGYSNRFRCIPGAVVYRPPAVTPKPVIQGLQTAMITGPPDEEIYTDKYGRVKAQFHWDREGQRDDKSSCWIRVSQVHAGAGWGGIDIPRVGEEVIVEFVEGDPDRPVITGRLYNGQSMPPYSLPDAKTTSGMKSDTYKGDGYNEIALTDTPGEEEIRIHAQYDMNSVVEHDQTLTVHNDRTTRVDVNHAESVGGNQSIEIEKDRTEKVQGAESYFVKGDRRITIGGENHVTIKSNQFQHVTGGSHSKVDGARTEKVHGDFLDVQGTRQVKTGNSFIVMAGNEVHVVAKSKMILEAAMEVTIKAGGNFIKLGADGITIFGAPMTKINSGGAPGEASKAGEWLAAKAPKEADSK